MTGGGKEAGLADIRFVGGRSRLAEFAVHARQLRRPLGDALLQRFVRLLQGPVGRNALCNVGEGCDDPLVRHGVRAYFDNPLSTAENEREGFVERQEMPHRLAEIGRRNVAALAEDRHDLRQRKADAADIFRQVEKLAEAPVPDRQLVGAVKNGDALVHLRKCRLQHVLVILQRLAGLVEQPCGVG